MAATTGATDGTGGPRLGVVRSAGEWRPDGELTVPASKSESNRAFVIAALTDGETVIRRALDSDDAAAMRDGIAALGAEVRPEADPDGGPSGGPDGGDPVAGSSHGTGADPGGGSWRITGFGAVPRPRPGAVVDCRLSGTTMRFLTAVAALAHTPVQVTGLAPLRARPAGPLVAALRSLGAKLHGEVVDGAERPPLTVGGTPVEGGDVWVDATGSSQFVSALAMIGPLLPAGLHLTWTGLAARGYVDLTVAAMRRRGAAVAAGPDALDVPGGQAYAPGVELVAADLSSASHVFTLAAASGGRVRVTGLAGAWDQPDGAVLDALAAMGATVTRLGPGGAPTGGTAVGAADTDADIDVVEVVGPERLAPVDLDLTATPDQLPNLAVLAALADGPSSFTGIEVTRHHETDRVASLRAELAKLGVRTDDVDGTLVVHGGGPLRPARLETHHDHRLAMAFAGLGCRLPGVEIADADCVSKTYPGFWRALAGLGSRWASTGET